MTTPNVSEALEKCPFCGSDATMDYDSGNEVWGQSWKVKCSKCWCETPKFFGSSSWSTVPKQDKEAESKAVEAWNKRTPNAKE